MTITDEKPTDTSSRCGNAQPESCQDSNVNIAAVLAMHVSGYSRVVPVEDAIRIEHGLRAHIAALENRLKDQGDLIDRLRNRIQEGA